MIASSLTPAWAMRTTSSMTLTRRARSERSERSDGSFLSRARTGTAEMSRNSTAARVASLFIGGLLGACDRFSDGGVVAGHEPPWIVDVVGPERVEVWIGIIGLRLDTTAVLVFLARRGFIDDRLHDFLR